MSQSANVTLAWLVSLTRRWAVRTLPSVADQLDPLAAFVAPHTPDSGEADALATASPWWRLSTSTWITIGVLALGVLGVASHLLGLISVNGAAVAADPTLAPSAVAGFITDVLGIALGLGLMARKEIARVIYVVVSVLVIALLVTGTGNGNAHTAARLVECIFQLFVVWFLTRRSVANIFN
jgi:hypothetical protein